MSDDTRASRLVLDLEDALETLIKAVFSQPVDKAGDSRVNIRPVMIKKEQKYQIERFRDNKAFHQNVDGEELLNICRLELAGKYRQALIVQDSQSAQYIMLKDGSYRKKSSQSLPRPGAGSLSHNREKEYILREGENIPALVDLGVFTQDLKIVRAKYDKYKQINRFVELIDQEFSKSQRDSISILDFGCGKSYLTFILYYYFSVKKGMNVKIIGYDVKADVVEHCNEIARKYGYEGLHFVCADVSRDRLYDEKLDMIVTLHACDTATDYALNYAIQKGADYIFSVPCCQHEINAQIKKGGQLDIFQNHGIIKERMSALLTDAIRAAVLEDMGYRVDMIEFIDFEHSPKNIMIRARKAGHKSPKSRKLAEDLSTTYGFEQTLLTLTKK